MGSIISGHMKGREEDIFDKMVYDYIHTYSLSYREAVDAAEALYTVPWTSLMDGALRLYAASSRQYNCE